MDGSFDPSQVLPFTYIKEMTLDSVNPPSGYLKQRPFVTLKGSNFYNVHSLVSKLVIDSSGEEVWFRGDLLFIDETELLIQMPNALYMDMKGGYSGKIFVSNNDGVDWSTGRAFTYYGEPHINGLSNTK